MTGSDATSSAIRCVVFDMDGLMLNTEDVYLVACKELAARHGRKLTPQIHHQMLGRRPAEAFGVFATELDLREPVEELIRQSRQIFDHLLDDLLQPMPGLFDCLDHAVGCNLPLAVATSSPRACLNQLLGRFNLLRRFRETLTAEDVQHGKPHPDIYLKIAERLEVSPESMLVLEDSEVGVQAAAAAGARVVAIPNRHTRHQDFDTAHHVLDRLNQPELLQMMQPIQTGNPPTIR